MKKITILTVILAVILLFSSCSMEITPHDFTQNGLRITLDTSFSRNTVDGYTASYRSGLATVYLLREAFGDNEDDLLKSDLSLSDYAAMVLKTNGMEYVITDHGDHHSFEYEVKLNDNSLCYYVCLYKMSDAFWTVQFVCDQRYYDVQKTSFESWASSVKDMKAQADSTTG